MDIHSATVSTLQKIAEATQARDKARRKAAEIGKEQIGTQLPASGNNEPPKIKAADVRNAAREIQNFLTQSQRELQFRVDEAAGRTVITVINPATREIIRQIPSEQVLQLIAEMRQQGPHLVNDTA